MLTHLQDAGLAIIWLMGVYLVMDKVNYVVFVDELELEESPTQKLTFYYFGVIIPFEKVALLEQEVMVAVGMLGKKKYHARKQYNKPEFSNLMNDLNKIIILNDLRIICFPFVKDWLKDPVLAVLHNIQYEEAPQIAVKNYHSQAWLLFTHLLNHHFSKYTHQVLARVYVDQDWLKPNQGISHEGFKLRQIEETIASKVSVLPLLALPDHTAYLFLEFKRQIVKSAADTENLPPEKKAIIVTAENLLKDSGLFTLLDLNEWIDHENKTRNS